jgi:predicted RNA-binding Zn-ribbon protein involved in translation (DUF1610 family)
MSDSSQIVVDVEVSDTGAVPLADSIKRWLVAEEIVENELSDSVLDGAGYRPAVGSRAIVAGHNDGWSQLLTNGLDIRIGRQVFETSGNSIELECTSCRAVFEPDESWFEAVGRWYEGGDSVTFDCPSCGRHALLNDWEGPSRWAFGSLGFEFWNWPPLSKDFVRALSDKLGHRTVVVSRRL